MGRIARILSFVRTTRNNSKISDVKIDTGGNVNATAENFSSAGDDSFPLLTDVVIASDIQQTGNSVVVGYLDPLNTPKAQKGDKRIYARQSSDGLSIVEVWLKNDGSLVMSNANGSVTLESNGDVKLKGGKIAIGNSSEELLDLIDQILTAIQAITTSTAIGPQPILNKPTFVTIQTALTTIKGVL